MIKLEKSPKPDVLAENEELWTDEYIRLKNGDTTVPKAAEFRYRHTEIKEALRKETSDKCIFCESKISHIFPGETDHIIPSSKKPEYIVKWDNLGYVCKECNHKKSNYHDEDVPLLNPFLDDPDEHLLFLGPIVLSRTANNRGKITTDILKLSRLPLVECRKERIEKVKALLDHAHSFPAGEAREYLINEANEEGLPDKEFSATVTAFLKAADA
ncbi:HNH endonuclease [Microbulbifer sp. ANSA003]|uniref:HNH endonuclease n=1 Tax=Microbulbifer sp. ANSA003 TaxID=3243360 RepID=UPI0040420576